MDRFRSCRSWQTARHIYTISVNEDTKSQQKPAETTKRQKSHRRPKSSKATKSEKPTKAKSHQRNRLDENKTVLHLVAVPRTSHSSKDGLVANSQKPRKQRKPPMPKATKGTKAKKAKSHRSHESQKPQPKATRNKKNPLKNKKLN